MAAAAGSSHIDHDIFLETLAELERDLHHARRRLRIVRRSHGRWAPGTRAPRPGVRVDRDSSGSVVNPI